MHALVCKSVAMKPRARGMMMHLLTAAYAAGDGLMLDDGGVKLQGQNQQRHKMHMGSWKW